MTTGGFSEKRLTRVRDVFARIVDSGYAPGTVVILARHGDVHTEVTGNLAYGGEGSAKPMAPDTICRIKSMTKPIVAACAMTLVEDCTLRLDDPVDEFLPELANMSVLIDPNGPLKDTVPACRPITLRDLLLNTFGTGMVPAEPGSIPISDALGALNTARSPDDWMRRLGELPLVCQPGERWMYDIASNVAGVLIARATGKTLGEALNERIFEPLGMSDTAFRVNTNCLDRMATAYSPFDCTNKLEIDDVPNGRWNRNVVFESGAGGLVSTANDYLAFASAMLAGGTHHGRRVLSRPAVTLMTSDHLSPAQKAVSGFWPGYFDDIGWGLGVSVRTRRTQVGPSVSTYGWSGYYGTAWYNDPAEDLISIVFMQRAHGGDQTLPMWSDIWTSIYSAIDD